MSNLHIWWGELLWDALARSGVRHVILSPGSRSTPLALAAYRHPRLTCTAVVDERCAAFVALGQARVTGWPAVVLCTSGTAGAHYFPAVIEASQANLPMLVLTADRPPELQGRGALQTTRQADLYGRFLRSSWELGVPDPHPAALAGLRVTAAMAVQASLDPRPGPVHLNAPLRTPLEPQPEDPDEDELRRQVTRLLASPVPRVAPAQRRAAPEALDALAEACASASRGVIVCGPLPPRQAAVRGAVTALRDRLGFPVMAEAGSQLRFCSPSPSPLPLELLAGADMPLHDFALVVGSWPTSAAWSEALTRRSAPRPWVVCEHGWVDPHNCADGVVVGEVGEALAGVVTRLGAGVPADPAWGALWAEVAAHGERVLAAVEEEDRSRGELSETTVARVAVRCLPEGGFLALGNSLAIREVDLACPASGVELQVLTQRGVSGIDGSISGAAGAALAAASPVLLITGDLAFQHDVGGLAVAGEVRTPLVILALDNRGGRIFELLPLAASAISPAEMSTLFVTPQRLDLALAARAFGVPSICARTVDELREAVAKALVTPGCTVVHGVIAPADRRQRRQGWREAAQASWRVGTP